MADLVRQVLYQGRWSAAARDLERDVLPMCRSEGMAIAPWGAIGQGHFQRKADMGKSKDGRSSATLTENEKKVGRSVKLSDWGSLTWSCVDLSRTRGRGGRAQGGEHHSRRAGVRDVQIPLCVPHHRGSTGRVSPPHLFLYHLKAERRSGRHLKANIGALDIHLTPEQVRAIDNALPFDYGQPMSEVSAFSCGGPART